MWLSFSYEFAGKINETYIEPTGRIVIANVDIAKDNFILVNVYSPTQNEHNSKYQIIDILKLKSGYLGLTI